METLAQILWGDNYENVLQFGYVIDNVLTDREAREGSEWVQGSSGVEDAWITGWDFTLEGDFRWIPLAGSTNPVATPFAGSASMQEFLDSVRDKNDFRFVPDATYPDFYIPSCYLVNPLRGAGELEKDHTRRHRLKIRNATVDFGLALRGLFLEYKAGGSLRDWTFSRTGVAHFHNKDLQVEQAATGVLRDRHYEGSTRTTLLEELRENLVTESENFGVWTIINTPIRTSGKADPLGGTGAYLIEDDDAAGAEGILRPVSFTGDATKAFAVFVRFFDAISMHLGLWDETVGTWRHLLNVTWTDGVPTSVTTSSGSGDIFPVVALGAGWYRILASANSVVAANANQLRLFGASSVSSATGGTYYFGAQAENATLPSSYIPTGASTVTRNADQLSVPFTSRPQAMTLYISYVEREEPTWPGSKIVMQIGKSDDTDPRVQLFKPNGTDVYRMRHDTGPSSVQSDVDLNPSVGDDIELRGVLRADGSIQMHGTLNGGAESSGPASAPLVLAQAWSDTVLWVNSISASAIGSIAVRHIKLAPGVHTMPDIRAK